MHSYIYLCVTWYREIIWYVLIYIVYMHGEINRSKQECLGIPKDFNNALCVCNLLTVHAHLV